MNIFLVEDERWALAELIQLFKIYEPKHHIYAFDNGDDALQTAQETRPDIVLTDITMPGIDGLELISKLREADPTIKGIILSVHDQFAYAQKGVRIGVVDYLLKPFKKDVLYQTIDSTIQSIEHAAKAQEAKDNWLITQMLFSSADQPGEAFSLIDDHNYFLILCFAEEGWGQAPMTNQIIKSCFAGETVKVQEIYCVDVDAKRKVVFVPLKELGFIYGIESSIHTLFRQLQKDMRIQLSYALKKANEPLDLLFILLNKRMKEQSIFGASTLISPDMSSKDTDLNPIWDEIRVLEKHIINADLSKGKESIKQMVTMLRMKEITSYQLFSFLNDMIYSLKFKLRHQENLVYNLDAEQEKIEDEVANYDQLTAWMENFILSFYSHEDTKDTLPKELIPVLLNWIHHNYHQNISLQQFASLHHVSLGYLSKMFKTQIGQTFSEYLVHFRIEKAKEFLTKGIDRVVDISQLVGYEDTKHFSALFKRIVGVTPKEYQKQIGKYTPLNRK